MSFNNAYICWKIFPDRSDKSSKKQLETKLADIEHENNKDKTVETPVSHTTQQNHPLTKQQWDLSKKILNYK